jgi:hypothetical protein
VLSDGGTWRVFPSGEPALAERPDLVDDRTPEAGEIHSVEPYPGENQPIGHQADEPVSGALVPPAEHTSRLSGPQVPMAERGPVVRPGLRASALRSLRGMFGRNERLLSGLDASGEVRAFRARDVEVRHLVSGGRRVGASFRSGDGPVEIPVSGSRPVFHLDVDAASDRFGLRLSDGTRVSVDGRTFAEVVAKAKPFRSAVGKHEPAGVALPGTRAGALTRAGGAAGDFRRGLAEFGHRAPVVAEDGAGGWRVFGAGPGPIAGTGEAGRVHLFAPEEVRSAPIRDGDAVVGVSFEGALAGLRGLPEADGLLVAATGHADRFEVTLDSGRKVTLSGEEFADLVSRTALFDEARTNRTGPVTLLASRTGERLWAGGAAFDFQRALTERTGTEVSVLAPGDELEVGSFRSRDGDPEVFWQTFSSRPVPATVPARAVADWAALGLDPAEVRADPLVRDGKVVGVSFHVDDAERTGDLDWGAAGGKDETYLLPPGQEKLSEAADAGREPAPSPAPWPANTFHVVVHTVAAPQGHYFNVKTKDGTETLLGGAAFADLVQRLEPFRSRAGQDTPEAIALVSCLTAAAEVPGQPAFDFQRAMVSAFGHRQPVLGATEKVSPIIRDGRAATTVSNGGTWRALVSRGTDALGTDATGRVRAFAPEDVRSRAITDGDHAIGVSFRDDGGWSGPEPARWPEGAVGAAVRVAGGRFSVTLADGRELALDGRNFAAVLAASPAYRAVAGDPPAALVLSADAGGAAREFQATLMRTFFRGEPVLVAGAGDWKVFSPEPALLPGTGADGRVLLFEAGEVRHRATAAGVSFTDAAPSSGAAGGFRITAAGDGHSFAVGLLDGTEARVSGGVLADVLAQVEALWPVDPGAGPERVTLSGSPAGELDAPGGAAHDFQRAVAERFGAWQPVTAPTADGGQRTFGTLPRPVRGTLFDPAEARMRETFFQPATVDVAPLHHGDRVVGVTFRTGTDRALAQSWAAAGGTVVEDGQVRPAPWGGSAFHVDAEQADGAKIRLRDRDGRFLTVDAETFADLVTGTEAFRQAFEGSSPQAIALLVSDSAVSGAAASFRRALADRSGRTEPVYAPTGDVDPDDGSSPTVALDGGEWQRFDGTDPAGWDSDAEGSHGERSDIGDLNDFDEMSDIGDFDRASERSADESVPPSPQRTTAPVTLAGFLSGSAPTEELGTDVSSRRSDAGSDSDAEMGARVAAFFDRADRKFEEGSRGAAEQGSAGPDAAVPAADRAPAAPPGRGARLLRSLKRLIGRAEPRLSGLDAAGEVRSFPPRDVVAQPLVSNGRPAGVSFRTGGDPVELPVSGASPVFHVDVDASSTRFGLRLADGGQVSVDGATFAEVLAKAKPFRAALKKSGLSGVVLPGSRVGALTRAGGAAHDFQRGLAALGRREAVVAGAGAGQWRVFGDGPLAGTADTGRVHLFTPDDVRLTPIRDGETVVGMSFRGELPDGGHPLPDPDTMPIAVAARPDRFEVTLHDGTRLTLPGDGFADLVSRSAAFEQARTSRTGGVTLLASRAGASPWPGGAARDFQGALARRLGTDLPVRAPGGDLDPATLATDWRSFPAVPGTRPIQGYDGSAFVDLDPADVHAEPLVRDGRVVGIAFSTEADGLEAARRWGAADGKEQNHLLAEKHKTLEQARAAGADPQPVRSPWPDNSFHLVSHTFRADTERGGFRIHLKDGRRLSLQGGDFARLVHGLPPFRDRMRGEDAPEAITLLACYVADQDNPGGGAHDFQATLPWMFDLRQPVLGPTTSVGVGVEGVVGGRAQTTLANGGAWRTFTSASANVLGTDTAGRVRAFAVEDVRSRVVTEGGRPIAVSFVDSPGWTGRRSSEWPFGAVGVDVRVEGDWFKLTLADGRELAVDAPAFAKVFTASPAFPEVLAGRRPSAFVVSAGTDRALSGFRTALAGSFHIPDPVVGHRDHAWTAYAADPAHLAGIGADGRVHVFAGGDVRLVTSTVDGQTTGVSFTGVAPPRGTRDEFRVVADGDEHSFRVRLADGREMAVSGGEFGHLLGRANVLGSLVPGTGPERITLAGSPRAGALDGPGGAAHDFQRTLAEQFEQWQPVSVEGGRRVFSTVRRPLAGVEFRPRGDGGARPAAFHPEQVLVAPLRHGDRVVGMSFRTDEGLETAQAWAAATGGSGTSYRLGPGQFDLELAHQRGKLGIEPSPWPHGTFHVDAEDGLSGIRIETGDGRSIDVDAATFAGLVAGAAPFRQTSAGAAPRALTLLVSGSGVPGGVAETFHRVLAERFGRSEPVYAPRTDVALLVRDEDGSSATLLEEDGDWARFGPPSGEATTSRGHDDAPAGPAATSKSIVDPAAVGRGPGFVPQGGLEAASVPASPSRSARWWGTGLVRGRTEVLRDVELPGLKDSRIPVRFRSSEVRVTRMKQDGVVIGAAFHSRLGTAPRTHKFARPHAAVTRRYPAGVNDLGASAKADSGGRYQDVRTPWPENSFFVSTHGLDGAFVLPLRSGANLHVDGPTFARLLTDLKTFRRALDESRPEALVLAVCNVGRLDVPGGAAHDFQRALGEFGVRQPVVAASRTVVVALATKPEALRLGVFDGGEWKPFLSGPAGVLGTDAVSGAVRYVDPAQVRSTTVVRDGQPIGISFRAERGLGTPSAGPGFLVDAAVDPDGRFTVETLDGGRSLLDGAALAKVVAVSRAFGEARPGTVTLPAVGSAAGAAGFVRVLGRDFGFDGAVSARSARGGWEVQRTAMTLPLPHDGLARRIFSADVRPTPIDVDGRQTGMSFRGDGPRSEPASAPGIRGRVFHIDAGANHTRFWVRSAGFDLPLPVTPELFAGLVAEAEPFRTALRDPELAVVALTDSRAGDERQGGAAHDFQRGLADLTGRPLPVVTGDRVSGWRTFRSAAPDGVAPAGRSALGSAKRWVTGLFRSRTEVVGNVELSGRMDGSNAPITFRSSDVAVGRLKKGGTSIGAVFHAGAHRKAEKFSFGQEHSPWTRSFSRPLNDLATVKREVAGGRFEQTRKPWPEHKTYFVSTHGLDGEFQVHLRGGVSAWVDGGTFASLLTDLQVFRRSMDRLHPDAVVLNVCWVGRPDEPGGGAHDFQRALAEFGWDQPVVAASGPVVGTFVGEGGRSDQAHHLDVGSGGRWKTFSSGAAKVLAADAGSGALGSVHGERIRSVPLLRAGRPVGVSFRDEGRGRTVAAAWAERGGLVAGGAPWPDRTFTVDAEPGPPGRFVVHTVDGRRLVLDGEAFAKVTAESRAFREAWARPAAVALLVPDSAAGSDGLRGSADFARVLGRDFGFEGEVFAPSGPVRMRPGAGEPRLFTGDGVHWEVHQPALLVRPMPAAAPFFMLDDVRGRPLEAGGRVVGMSFRPEGAEPSALRVSASGGPVFHVDVEARWNRFFVSDNRGRSLPLDGVQFARLLANAEPFLAAARDPGLAAIAVQDSGPAARLGSGGVVHDLQRALADLGHPLPVVAGFPEWRVFGAPDLVTGALDGARVRVFSPSEVRVSPVHEDGVPVGVSYRGRVPDLPATGSLPVVVDSRAGSFVVTLSDGRRVSVSGEVFGRLVGGSALFARARANRPGALTLLASRPDLLGDAESSFHRTVAERFGIRAPSPEPVVRLHADSARLPRPVAGLWRRVAGFFDDGRAEVVDGVTLSGREDATGSEVRFGSSQVQAYRLEKQDGTTAGIAFHVEEDLWGQRRDFRYPHSGHTVHYPVGVRTAEDAAASDRAGTTHHTPVPWPPDTFHVVTHGRPRTMMLTLDDGRVLSVDGTNMGRLLHDLRPVREALAGTGVEAVALVVCETGAADRPGGAAHDLQRTLGQLGYRQPVLAPTKLAASSVRGAQWQTAVLDGGDWRVLSAAPARLLGLDDTQAWHAFEPGEVHAVPLVRDGRTVGVSYRPDGPELTRGLGWAAAGTRLSGGRSWPDGTFFVDTESGPGGRPVVYRDGRALTVEGRTFGQVLARTEVFRTALAGPDSPAGLAVLTSPPADPWTATRQSGSFGRALDRELGARFPAFVPSKPVWVTLPDGIVEVDGGQWDLAGTPPRTGSASRIADSRANAVVEDAELSGFDPVRGDELVFQSSEVRFSVLERDGQAVGVTFRDGASRELDLEWGRGAQAGETYLFEGARGASEPAVEPRPWPGDTFFVSAPGLRRQLARIVLTDGTRLNLDGATLGRLVHDLEPFRSTVDSGTSAAVTLLASYSSLVDGPDGLAHDFQAVLAGEFGHRQPVFAPTNRLEQVVFDEGVAGTILTHGGRWLPYDLPTVVDDVVLTGRNPQTRTTIRFRASQVVAEPMTRHGRVVGATFKIGEELAYDRDWGRSAKIDHTYRFPGTYDRATHYDEHNIAVEQVPWPEHTFYVTTHGSPRGKVTLNLVDGIEVRVDGATYARLLEDTRFFRAALDTGRFEAITMVVCYGGKIPGPGGIAHDFQHTLATEFGRQQPVFGGTTVVQALRFHDEEGGAGTGLDDMGTWVRFPAEAPVAAGPPASPRRIAAAQPNAAMAGDVELSGSAGATTTFRASEVRMAPLAQGGRVVGMTFKTGAGLEFDRAWGAAGKVGETHRFGATSNRETRRDRLEPNPWPDGTFHVVAHGSDRDRVHVVLTDGTPVRVDGATFARLLGGTRDFRAAMDQADAIALLVCHAAANPRPGGIAHDFQRVLAAEFGHRQPVFGGTTEIETIRYDDGMAGTGVTHGGRWRRFPDGSGPGWRGDRLLFGDAFFSDLMGPEPATVADVPVTGVDRATGAPRVFRSSEAVLSPLERDGEVVGVTFGERDPGHDLSTAPEDTFFVSADGTPRQAFVRLTDGREIGLDGTNLGALVNDLDLFRSLEEEPAGRLALLVPGAATVDEPGGLAHDFQDTLAGTFGHRRPVLASTDAGSWRTFHRPVVRADLELTGADALTSAPAVFRSSQVEIAAMEHRGRVVGASFGIGEARELDLTWAAANQAEHTELLTRDWRTREPRPWPSETFYVTTHGTADQRILVHLTEGADVLTSGETFARLLGDVRFFHRAMERDNPAALTMLVCYAGAVNGPGGAAHDFHQTLARDFDYRQPVYAATKAVNVSLSLSGETARTAVERGGSWRRFGPAGRAIVASRTHADVADPAGIVTDVVHLGVPDPFMTSDVVFTPLVRDGRAVGVSFRTVPDVELDLDRAVAAHPGDTFFVSAPGAGGRAFVQLSDGVTATIGGGELALLVRDLQAFRSAVDVQRPGRIALIVPDAAGPGVGLAHDFQATLAQQYGHRSPVTAPLTGIGEAVPADAAQWQVFERPTVLEDVTLSGVNPLSGEPVVIRSSQVLATPLEHDERIVGATFAAGAARDRDLARARAGSVTGPWPEPSVHVSAAGRDGLASVRTVGGAEVTLGGSALAKLVHDLGFLRSASQLEHPAALVVRVPRASDVEGPGGLAHDFQAALAGELGYRQPVFAPAEGGRWRRFRQPAVVTDLVLPGLDAGTGDLVRFPTAEVVTTALTNRGRVVGVSFRQRESAGTQQFGDSGDADVRWARATQSGETVRFHGSPADALGGLDPAAWVAEPTPWADDTFFVLTHGLPYVASLHLENGTNILVSGQILAWVLANLRLFRTAMQTATPSAVTMLVCYAAAENGPGGLAHDFQRALARDFGYRLPVFASPTLARTLISADGLRGSTGLDNGAHWQRFGPPDQGPGPEFPATGARAPLTLRPAGLFTGPAAPWLDGRDAVSGGRRTFPAGQVRATALTSGGRPIGISFDTGADLLHDRIWASAGDAERQITYAVPDPEQPSGWLLGGKSAMPYPAPWPENPFYLVTHGELRGVHLTLADGSKVVVDGVALARLTASLESFRNAITPDDQRAIVLVICLSGAIPSGGGVAHHFQRTLAGEFGYRQPVVAPSRTMWMEWRVKPGWRTDLLLSGKLRVRATTGIVDNGRWHSFSSPDAGLLGADASGRWHYFEPAEVRTVPLATDGGPAGVSFRSAPGALPARRGAPWPARSFHVEVTRSGHDYQVRLADGRRLLVDARSFGRVVAESAPFRTALDAHAVESMVLLPVEPRHVAPADATPEQEAGLAEAVSERQERVHASYKDFRGALDVVAGYRRPVFVPAAELPAPGAPQRAGDWTMLFGERPLIAADDARAVHFLYPSDIQVTPMSDGSRVFGLSYREAGTETSRAGVPSRLFSVDAEPAARGGFRVRLPDGTPVRLSEDLFAEVVAQAEPVRELLRSGELGAMVVSGDEAFAWVLSAELGRTLGATPRVWAWSAFTARPVGGALGSGEPVRFEPADVVAAPLTKRGRTIGITFDTNEAEVAIDHRWAEGTGKRTTYLLPGGARTLANARAAGLSAATRAPWTGQALYLTTHGQPRGFQVTLKDGRQVVLDGAAFARTVAGLPVFRDAMAERRPDSLALISCNAGAVDGPGGAAFDFQRTLAAEFGYRQPVAAPTAPVEMVLGALTAGPPMGPPARLSRTAVTGGGRWQVFASGALLGADAKGRFRVFDPEHVRVTPIVEGGRVAGMSFRAGEVRPPSGAGDRVFHVAARVTPRGFEISLDSGAKLAVGGRELALLVAESRLLQDSANHRPAEAFVLLAPGGGAAEFQGALASHFGYVRPVVAPAGKVVPSRLEPGFDVLRPETAWRVFRPAGSVSDFPENPASGAPHASPGLREFLNGGAH